MWNFSVPRNCTHCFMLLPSFRAKYCYLFICLFILCQFVLCQHIPWDTQIILFLLGPLGSGRRGCPFLQAHFAKFPLLCVYSYSPLSSSTPRWGLLQLPAQFQLALHTRFALLLENLFPLSDLCPEGTKFSLWICLRVCSALRGTRKAFL